MSQLALSRAKQVNDNLYDKSSDATCMCVCLSGNTADASEGGFDVNIMHHGGAVPIQMQADGLGLYRVNFTPEGAGIYTIKVFFASMKLTGELMLHMSLGYKWVESIGESIQASRTSLGKRGHTYTTLLQVPSILGLCIAILLTRITEYTVLVGSQYTPEIFDSSMVTASGEGDSSVEANRGSTFIVNAGQKGSTGNIRVTITCKWIWPPIAKLCLFTAETVNDIMYDNYDVYLTFKLSV